MVRVASGALLLDRPIVAYFFEAALLPFRDSFLGFTGLPSSDDGAVALDRCDLPDNNTTSQRVRSRMCVCGRACAAYFLGLAVLALGGLPSRGSMMREYL